MQIHYIEITPLNIDFIKQDFLPRKTWYADCQGGCFTLKYPELTSECNIKNNHQNIIFYCDPLRGPLLSCQVCL